MKIDLHLDVTAWVRGPRTSVGLCARRLDAALHRIATNESGLGIKSWTRRNAKSSEIPSLKLESKDLYSRVEKLGWLKSWEGVGGVYHSVDPVLGRLKNSKRVVTAHDCWTLVENPYQAPKFQKYQKKKFETALSRADHVVVPSQHVHDQLVVLKPELKGRLSVIPWGPLMGQETALSPASAPHASVVDAYLTKHRPFFLCVGNLENRKNHDILFRAMESLPEVDLVLVGAKGWGWEAIEKKRQELCAKTPCFWFEGLPTRDMSALYAASLAVVLPSLDEGFGLPACEALYFDKPLVLSQIAPFFEIAGSAALYFDPVKGTKDLRDILAALASDESLRNSWASKALSRKHLFSWELTARAHLALYRRL
ncbi:MAG: glycosyltransferase family 1 protein [Bdellovibrionota bacterium]